MSRLHRPLFFGALPHGSKLERREMAPSFAPAALTEKDRQPVLDHDGGAYQHPEGRGKQSGPNPDKQDVEAAFEQFPRRPAGISALIVEGLHDKPQAFSTPCGPALNSSSTRRRAFGRIQHGGRDSDSNRFRAPAQRIGFSRRNDKAGHSMPVHGSDSGGQIRRNHRLGTSHGLELTDSECLTAVN